MNYNRLQKKDYQIGSKEGLKNAKNLLTTAKLAGNEKLFGTARSLLIIACEELAKSVMLKIKDVDNTIEIKNLNAYFKGHKIKHDLTFKFFLLIIEEKWENEKSSKEDKMVAIALLLVVVFLFVTSDDITETYIKRLSLERIRQKGLYLEYYSDVKKWNFDTLKLDLKAYEDALKLTKGIFEYVEIQFFSKKVSKERVVNFLKDLDDLDIN